MADEEKKYLITAEAQVQNALAGLAQLESALTRLGEAERRMAGTASQVNNVSTQAQANTEAINRETAAYENLNRARQEQGRLSDTKRTSQVTTNAETGSQTRIESLKQEAAAYELVTKKRLDAEGKLVSTTTRETTDLRAQRNAGLQYNNRSIITEFDGSEKKISSTMENIGGSFRETERLITQNGATVSKVSTYYTKLAEGVYQTDTVTRNFNDTAEKGVGTLDHLAKRISFMAEWFAFYAAIQLVQKGLQDWNQAQIALSDEMANFEIVTRGSNSSAEAYLTTVNAISKATAINPAEIGPGVVAQMRVFNAPSDLALRAAQVQRVTGVDNAQVQREIMGLRLQFPDRTTIGILDAFSGALKRSSLNADELFSLLETAGPLSQQFNTGLEQILGMMAGLSTVTSESGQAVELYMRQMDRLYSDPRTRAKVEQFTGKPVVGTDLTTGQEVRRPLYDVMADISKLDQSQVQEIANTIPNALGQKTRQLFVAMVNGWANVEDATKSALNAQGEFLSQNETKMKSYTAAIDGVSAAWQRTLRGFGNSSAAITVLREIASWLDYISKVSGGLGSGGIEGAKSSFLSSPIALTAALVARYSPVGVYQRAEEQREVRATERREFLTDRLDRDVRPAQSQAWANSVRFPEQQVTTVSRSATALAERFYEQAMQQRVQGAATFMMGGPTENKAYIESIKQMIGVNEQQIAVVNELTGEVVVTTKDQVMYQDALKKAAEMLNRTPEEWAQSFLRGREPASLWGGKTPADYKIPTQGIELPNGVDRQLVEEYAKELQGEFVFAQRGLNPALTAGKTDAQVLDLAGIKTEMVSLVDSMGIPIGQVNSAFVFLAPAIKAANDSLRDMAIPAQRFELPNNLDLGSVVKDAEKRQTEFIKAQRAYFPEQTKGKSDAEVSEMTGAGKALTVIVDSIGGPIGIANASLQDLAASSDAAAKTLRDNAIPAQRFEVPEKYMVQSKFGAGEGTDKLISNSLTDSARKLRDEYVASYRGMYPEQTKGKTDIQVLDLTGISNRFTTLTDNFGNALGAVDIPLMFLANAANAAAKALENQIPTQRFEVPEKYRIQSKAQNGVEAITLISNELTDRARKLRDEYVTSYREQYPEVTKGMTDVQVLDLTGISSRFTTLTDNFGNALGTVDIPLMFLANAATNAAAALSNLSFVSPPEGVSLGAYGSLAQSYAVKAQSTLDLYGDPNQPRPKRSQIWADDEGGVFKTTVEVSDQAAAIGLSAASKQLSTVASQSKEANNLLKQIAEGVRSFASKLLEPTPVTEGDMALAKTGGYKDKWDEPVRKIQDVMDRRAGDNPNLGPWKGFAESMGIDLSSKASTVATGEQFKSKFYSGQMAPEFYDQYSKEGFLAAAKEELAAQKGKERLTDQAVGWLKESGMDKDVSKFIGRKLTGDVSPIEEMLYAGKDPKKVGKDIEASAKPIGEGLVKGVGSAFTFEAMYSALEAGWKLKDAEAQKKIMGLGGQVGALLTSGAATSFGDKFLDAVIAAVLARLDKEYL